VAWPQVAVATAARRLPRMSAAVIDPVRPPATSVHPIHSVIYGNRPITAHVARGPMAGKFGGSAS